MNNKTLPIVAFLALAALLAWTLIAWQPQPAHEAIDPTLSGKPPGGDFGVGGLTLESLRGKVVLLYFGYMGCPDICPTSLADMGRALKQLSQEEAARTQGLFISVDVQRDKPTDLTNYANYFHANIMGHTGSKSEVDQAVMQYGAAYRIVDHDSAGGYQVDHTANIYVITPDGRWVDTLPYAVAPEKIAAAVRAALDSGNG